MRCSNCAAVLTPIANGYHCHGCGMLIVDGEELTKKFVEKKEAPRKPRRREWLTKL